MTGWAGYAFVACSIGAFIAWLAFAISLIRFWAELIRAWRAGEINTRQALVEIPLRWPFKKDALPRVEADRRRFLRAFVAFFACIGLALAIGLVASHTTISGGFAKDNILPARGR